MRKATIIACILLSAYDVSAQKTSGKIVYSETVKFDINIDEGPAAQFRDLIPREQKFTKILYFNPDATLYEGEKAKAKDNEETDHTEGGVRMVIRMDVPEDKIYTGLKEGKLVEQREFMGRKFLVSSEIKKEQWKLTGKQKQVLDYPCQQAILYHGDDTITAWFSPAIPVSSGPQGFGGLPGMILEAAQNSQLVLVATAVAFSDIDAKLLQKPKEGKKVTKDEYRAIVAAKQKEMQEENGGDGNVIIKVRNN